MCDTMRKILPSDNIALPSKSWFDMGVVGTGMKTTRSPHAPSTSLSLQAVFLVPFRVHFQRREGLDSGE